MLEKYDFSLESNIKESLFNKINDEFVRLHENTKPVRSVISFEQLSGRNFGATPGTESGSVKPREKGGGGRKL